MFRSRFDLSTEFQVFDDFDKNNIGAAPATWLLTKGTGGTVALESTGGTWIDIPTAASASDYMLISSAQPIIALAQKKTIDYIVRFKCTEANTNKANLCFGLTSILTAGWSQAANAGPPATWTGAMFYKTGNGMTLGFRTSAGAVNTDNPNFATLVSGTTYQLAISVNLNDPTNAVVTPTINGVTSLTAQLAAGKINQAFTYGTGNVLYPVAGVAAGSASAETLSLDYLGVMQIRT